MPYRSASAPVTYTVGGKQYVTVEVGGSATTTFRARWASPIRRGCAAIHLHVRAAVAKSTRSWAAADPVAAHEHPHLFSVCCAAVRCRPVGTLAEIVIFEEGFHA